MMPGDVIRRTPARWLLCAHLAFAAVQLLAPSLAFADVLCTDPIGSKNVCPASSTFAGSPLIAQRIRPRTT